jgi:hypothetical protein
MVSFMTPLLHFPERRVAGLRLPLPVQMKDHFYFYLRVISIIRNPLICSDIGSAVAGDSTEQLGCTPNRLKAVNITYV